MQTTLDWNTYSEIARQAAAEGCVLLRNENEALPACAGETVAVFGRIQLDYYKSGTGSGGMVNVPYVRSILDGLQAHPEIRIYEPLLATYRDWTKEHPFDRGTGWGTEPWCQQEMPLEDSVVEDAARHADLALVVLGRTAGEDRDNSATEGSYYLTDGERAMLAKVCSAFSRTAVLLNVGNIIDMKWVCEYKPSAVLYVWQGGMEGGMGAADVICGTVSPSGKLSDTIALDFTDYPSSANFGSHTENLYTEDIYVGYRYFETFAKDRVLYPFGFGLSYTSFAIGGLAVKETSEHSEKCLTIDATITNTGTRPGKEVVQVYVEAPQGLLGKPASVLCAFAKTDCLQPGEAQTLTMTVETSALASYDDSGVTGHKSCYVLEAGQYHLYVGADVRSAALAGSFTVAETFVTRACQEAMAPVKTFSRLHSQFATAGASRAQTGQEETSALSAAPAETSAPQAASAEAPSLQTAQAETSAPQTASAEPSVLQPSYEPAPLRTVRPDDRRAARLPDCLPYTGDRGWKLADVRDGKVGFPEFLAQLSDADLIHIVHGEGMCSPKVTPGTAAAFGGITESLQHFGIPAGCCSDGPSGIRMDCGATAFSLPNGTLLACSFNLPLVTQLFELEGLELRSNHIDTLLGPGINIHRNPLNGRNFEYHSEDPYLTGKMAEAQAAGMDASGVTGTLKHFCGNNQETCRHDVDSVVSERALREIYLKPFEICIRSGHVRSVMTSYNPVNGIWSAGNYDLNTTILRGEWGYTGMVMTDWWAKMNDDGHPADRTNLAAMVRAQNDVFMVTPDATASQDNLAASLADGTLTRAELVRSAENICRFLLTSPAMETLLGTYTPIEHRNRPSELAGLDEGSMEEVEVGDDTQISLLQYPTEAGTFFLLSLHFAAEGAYRFSLTASTEFSEHAQMAVTLNIDGTVLHTYSYHGGSTEPMTLSRDKELRGTTHYLKVFFSHTGLKLHSLRIQKL